MLAADLKGNRVKVQGAEIQLGGTVGNMARKENIRHLIV
jgi:hypothetical protein